MKCRVKGMLLQRQAFLRIVTGNPKKMLSGVILPSKKAKRNTACLSCSRDTGKKECQESNFWRGAWEYVLLLIF